MMNPLHAIAALSLKGKAIAAAALLSGGYLVARGLGLVGASPAASSAAMPPPSGGPIAVPAANMPSTVNPLTGQRTTPGASSAAGGSDPFAAAAAALAIFIGASGCKDPNVMRSCAAYQKLVGLTSDGMYGPATRADMAKRLTTAPPPACSWSSGAAPSLAVTAKPPAVGASGAVISNGIGAMQTAIAQASGSGITNLGGAIAALQAAGQAGASTVGPAIDARSGGSSQVMNMTQWAWSKNGSLAALPSDGSATKSDLAAALAALAQMTTWYGQAYKLAAG